MFYPYIYRRCHTPDFVEFGSYLARTLITSFYNKIAFPVFINITAVCLALLIIIFRFGDLSWGCRMGGNLSPAEIVSEKPAVMK
jgi:hypothetical protein